MKDKKGETAVSAAPVYDTPERLALLAALKSMIGTETVVFTDRPLGSRHPKFHDLVYPVNYGYIKEYRSADGDYVDAYILGVSEPVKSFKGVIEGVVRRTDDCEDKLIVTPAGCMLTKQEAEKMINFQEKYFSHELIFKEDLT